MLTMKKRLLAAMILGALALAQIVPAAAGSSGQQIVLYEGPTVGYVSITGNNQYGNYGNWWSGNTPNPGSYWYYIPYHWWQGWVDIAIWWPDGSYYGVNGNCAVPVSQAGDWYTCYVPY
ncbi:MAG: hypothetical protein ACSLFM_04700 [Tepidiformaceae bacterium]